MKIAVLGTGLMGAPMARRLAKAGHEVTVWNRNAARSAALADVARTAPTPAEAVAEADLVITMLLDGPATRSVLLDQGALSAARAGACFIDMGSVDPATDRALAAMAQARGCGYLDAPVSGGVVGAEAGTLSIFVGGDAELAERMAPVLRILGRPSYLGASGAGQVAKLANQLIVAITIGAVAEGLRLGAEGGCDPAALREALRGGFADSRILELHGRRMVEGDFTPGGRSSAQLKDLDNAMALATGVNLDLPLSRTVQAAFRDLVEVRQGADLDHSAYWLWLSQRS
ncbi:MAG: NAD(P)-dependent oxidoreductase [Gemmobacter sp.]